MPVLVVLEATVDKLINVGLIKGKVVEVTNEEDAAYNINQWLFGLKVCKSKIIFWFYYFLLFFSKFPTD